MVIAITCTGCGNGINTRDVFRYLKEAEEGSELYFSVYEGKTTTIYTLEENKQVKKILKELSRVKAVPVSDWNPAEEQEPYYGIAVKALGGTSLQMFFANGKVMLEDGRQYEFDYDLSKFQGKYAWSKTDYRAGCYVPCAYYLAHTEEGFDERFLTESNREVNDKIEILFDLEKGEDEFDDIYMWDCVIYNNMGMDFVYGAEQDVEVEIDGAWYHVPIRRSPVIYDSAERTVPMGGSREITFYMEEYDDLPKGKYRVLAIGKDVCGAMEFNIN